MKASLKMEMFRFILSQMEFVEDLKKKNEKATDKINSMTRILPLKITKNYRPNVHVAINLESNQVITIELNGGTLAYVNCEYRSRDLWNSVNLVDDLDYCFLLEDIIKQINRISVAEYDYNYILDTNKPSAREDLFYEYADIHGHMHEKYVKFIANKCVASKNDSLHDVGLITVDSFKDRKLSYIEEIYESIFTTHANEDYKEYLNTHKDDEE